MIDLLARVRLFVHQEVEKLARTAVEFPPMQKGHKLPSRCSKGKNPSHNGGDGQVGLLAARC
jgi:hypothetical protein